MLDSSLSYMEQIGVSNETWKDSIPVLVSEELNFTYAIQWWSDYSRSGRIWDEELTDLVNEALAGSTF